MRQLTSLDAQFLALESSNQTGHVAGLAILDPSSRWGTLGVLGVIVLGIPVYYLTVGRSDKRGAVRSPAP